MFLMRRAKIEDVPTLLKLAKMVHFINLPADRDIIADKAMWSRQCFQRLAQSIRSGRPLKEDGGDSPPPAAAAGVAAVTQRTRLYMFVLEDTESGGVLGTSQIIAQMGGPGQPNVSLELARREMFSKTLQTGATHMTAKLRLDESGPTEIGGLILQPSYRGHKAKLGRFLSLVRFHFIGLYRPLFRDRVLAEMMAPITADGRSTFWEYFGRRFINLTYTEADRFCQYSKEFIISLLPKEEIYLTLLPPEARSAIGEVGPETVPARRMLEKLGFEYRNRIDPFDGGPNLEAVTDEITPVRETRRVLVGDPIGAGECRDSGIVSTVDPDGEFRALSVRYCVETRGGTDRLRMMRDQLHALQMEPGMEAGWTPLEVAPAPQRKPKARAGATPNGRHGAPKPAREKRRQRS